MNPVFHGSITNGDFRLFPADKGRFKKFCSTRRIGPHSITIKRVRDKRSIDQNAYYWGVVVQIISSETGNDPETVHEFLKLKFLGTVRVFDVDVPRSSANLDKVQFKQFWERVQRWSESFLGIIIPNPKEVDL